MLNVLVNIIQFSGYIASAIVVACDDFADLLQSALLKALV